MIFNKYHLGRKVSQVQRNFPYPIRRKILKVSECLTKPVNSYDTHLVVLAQHKSFLEGLWTAWTWLYYLKQHIGLIFILDGEVTKNERKIFNAIFPSGEISGIMPKIDEDLLSNIYLSNFLKHHTYGKVFLLKVSLQRKYNVLFSDPDVLCFCDPVEVRDGISKNVGLYCTENNCSSFDPWIFDKAKQLNAKRIQDFNSGLLFIPHNYLSLDLCYELINGWTLDVYHHFTEQTLLDVMMCFSGAKSLPVNEYVVSSQGMWFWQQDIDYKHVKVRHFVGNVRHRMYLYGYPRVVETMFHG